MEKVTINLGFGFGLQIPDGMMIDDVKFVDIKYKRNDGICEHNNQIKYSAEKVKES